MSKNKYLFPELKLPPQNQQCEIDPDNNKFWETFMQAIINLYWDKTLHKIDDILNFNHPV